MKRFLVFLLMLCCFSPLFAEKYTVLSEIVHEEVDGSYTFAVSLKSSTGIEYAFAFNNTLDLGVIVTNATYEKNFEAEAQNHEQSFCGIGYIVISADETIGGAMVYQGMVEGVYAYFEAEKSFMIKLLNTFFLDEFLVIEKYKTFDDGVTFSDPYLEYIEAKDNSELSQAKTQFERFIKYLNK